MAGEPHRVVILGAGFGGLAAAQGLAGAPIELTIVDRRNHHLFQPLLYQVATAALSPADIAVPIRSLFSGRPNVRVLLGTVTGIDTAMREVRVDEHRLAYDTLIVATGARHAYFGHDDWEAAAPGLKRIEDAPAIRRKLLLAFEHAENAMDAAERRRLLNFVVVGAGPTGVEIAGSIAELAKMALARNFQAIDPRDARIILIEAGPRILTAFPEELSVRAQKYLEKLGVEVRLGEAVTCCDADGVLLGNELLPAATIVWAAGVAASPAATWLGVESDRAGRVRVGADLTLPGHSNVYVIGDTSLVIDSTGNPLPGLAPVAKQQGAYVAKLVRARLRGGALPAFRYHHLGNLATVGRGRAIADFGWIRLAGSLAWLLWGMVHIAFLIGFRNRAVVLLDWLWAYVSFKRGARLITGGPTM